MSVFRKSHQTVWENIQPLARNSHNIKIPIEGAVEMIIIIYQAIKLLTKWRFRHKWLLYDDMHGLYGVMKWAAQMSISVKQD